MIFAITVAPTACKYFVCLLRECPACVRLGNAKASFRAALALLVIEQAHDSAGIKWESTSGLSLDTLACHSRHRAGISFLSSSTEGRGSSAYSGLIVDIIRLGLSKKDNLFLIKNVFMLL